MKEMRVNMDREEDRHSVTQQKDNSVCVYSSSSAWIISSCTDYITHFVA